MSADVHFGSNISSLGERDGFRLISSRLVALPVWSVELRCLVLSNRNLSATEEFVLRGIKLGLDGADEICDLLNLPPEIVDGVISGMLSDRYLMVETGDTLARLRLSASGEKLVKTLIDSRPVERKVRYHIDGITGEPVSQTSSALLSAHELDITHHLVLDPEVEVDLDFSPADTPRFFSVQPSMRRKSGHDLLTVIETVTAVRHYRSAAGLLFESVSDESDRYLRICIDGRSDKQTEENLRVCGAISALRFDSRIKEDRMRIDRALPASLLKSRAPDLLVEELRREIHLTGVGLETNGSLESGQQVSGATSVLKARTRLASENVRRLECLESTEALVAALSSARQRVVISTSRFWPQMHAIDYGKILSKLLASGVSVGFETPAQKLSLSKVEHANFLAALEGLGGYAVDHEQTKPDHEANFILIDSMAGYVFAGSPFAELATLPERFGDDRATSLFGSDVVEEFLTHVVGRNSSRNILRDFQN